MSQTNYNTYLVLASLMHSILGIAIAIIPWAIGTKIASIAKPTQHLSTNSKILVGYIFSIPISLLAAIAILNNIWTAAIVAIAAGYSAFSLCTIEFRNSPICIGNRTFLWTVTIGVALGTWFGIEKHGPTQWLDARPHGDFTFYASAIQSIFSANKLPIPDLSIEGEYLLGFNLLFPAIGASLMRLFPIDSFLFIGGTGAAYFFVTTFLCLHVHLDHIQFWRSKTSNKPLRFAILFLSILTISLYPSWIVDSIPMIYGAAVTISFYHLLSTPTKNKSLYLLTPIFAVAATLLTKVISASLFLPLSLIPIKTNWHQLSKIQRIIMMLVAIVVMTYVLSMLYQLGPRLYQTHSPMPLSIIYAKCCHAALADVVTRDVSTILLIVFSIKYLPGIMGASIAGTLTLGLVYPILFSSAVNFSFLFIALLALKENSWQGKKWPTFILLVAALLATPRSAYGDPSSTMNWAWTAAILAGAAITIASAKSKSKSTSRHIATQSKLIAKLPALVLIFFAVATALFSGGRLKVESGQWLPVEQYPSLQPEDADVWTQIANTTPYNSLIFVDSIGKGVSLLEGWNTYATHGRRQVYISQWMQSKYGSPDSDFMKDRISTNSRVISGEIPPYVAPVTSTFEHYYGVIKASRTINPGWQLKYRNSQYAIIEWIGIQ